MKVKIKKVNVMRFTGRKHNWVSDVLWKELFMIIEEDTESDNKNREERSRGNAGDGGKHGRKD